MIHLFTVTSSYRRMDNYFLFRYSGVQVSYMYSNAVYQIKVSTFCYGYCPSVPSQPNDWCSCPIRQFAGPSSCLPCPYDCYTCNSTGACLSCSSADSRVLDLNSSRCIPIDGYFDNNVTVSTKCLSKCSLCSSLTICSACSSRYFLNISASTCDSCPYDCFTCNSFGNCLTCNSATDHRELDNSISRCVPMPGYF